MSKDPILNRKHQREWYDRNREKKKALTHGRMKAHRGFTDQLKNAPCMDCGNSFPPVCMDFDHRPGEEKLFGIGKGWYYSREEVVAEIAKCDLVCANCHRIRTEDRRATNDNS